MRETYFTYILASPARHRYIGVTNDLHRRLSEHRLGPEPEGWAHRHGATRLVYFQSTPSVRSAIQREKQLKALRRAKKIALIESYNPDWKDLGEGLSDIRGSATSPG